MSIKDQIIAIRDTGITNMFDTNKVQLIALRFGYFELVEFIQEHKKAYVEFILYGDEEVLDCE